MCSPSSSPVVLRIHYTLELSRKLKKIPMLLELPFDTAITLLGLYQKENKLSYQKNETKQNKKPGKNTDA